MLQEENRRGGLPGAKGAVMTAMLACPPYSVHTFWKISFGSTLQDIAEVELNSLLVQTRLSRAPLELSPSDRDEAALWSEQLTQPKT